MMASLLLNLEMLCEMTVLPQPKAPGTAQVPPCTDGKMVSTTRRPVVIALSPGSFSMTGLGRRTGQKCESFKGTTSPRELRTSRTVSCVVKASLPSVPAP